MLSIHLGSRGGKGHQGASRWCRRGARTQTNRKSSSGVATRDRESQEPRRVLITLVWACKSSFIRKDVPNEHLGARLGPEFIEQPTDELLRLVCGCGDEWGRQERREVCFTQIRQFKNSSSGLGGSSRPQAAQYGEPSRWSHGSNFVARLAPNNGSARRLSARSRAVGNTRHSIMICL